MPVLKDRVSAEYLLKRPEVGWGQLRELGFDDGGASLEIREQLEVQVKYDGYIKRDLELLEGVRKHEGMKIPLELDFDAVPGLSTEIRGRLLRTRPESIGQASRMQGMTPAAVASLMIFMKMKDR
jgi:tRNA uridine 5-carboxymethylaminomethyl modification enzyme